MTVIFRPIFLVNPLSKCQTTEMLNHTNFLTKEPKEKERKGKFFQGSF